MASDDSSPKKEFDRTFSTASDEDVLKRMGSGLSGLTHQEVRRRHARYGFNAPSIGKEASLPSLFLQKFKDPLIIVLAVVAMVSLALGQEISAFVVIIMALVSVVLSFIQEYKARNEAKKLREMISTKTTVIREGKPHDIDIKHVVPGDIIDLSAGDIIPADLRILSAKDLFINQAALTGESYPVEKSGGPLAPKSDNIIEMGNVAFMGSNVVSGTAMAVVIKTGSETQFGTLAKMVSGMDVQTRFDIGIHEFVLLLIKFMVVMVVFIFGVNTILKGNILEAFLFSLAVAVGLTPEMLPFIVTVNLSNGALSMSKKKVIVKRLSSIQNFGAMDVLCTDKTGTLTLGEVILEKHFDLEGKESEEVLRYAYINSYFQTGLKNLLDKAILKHEHPSLAGCRKIDEIPFDFSRKLMSVVIEEGGRHILVSKGAPEEVVKRCGRYEIGGKIFKETKGRMPRRIMELSGIYRMKGFRVLAVAYRDFDRKKTVFSKDDENDLILKGFMIFLDPPKTTAKKAIERLSELGIPLKVLTGDNEMITTKICSDVGLDVKGVATGDMIERLGDKELRDLVETTSVFARLTPVQKERIIEALRKNGHTVGYMGDGINDAPALKEADVGISVDNAVDIAKETADIILLEKSLMVLGDGVVEGRKTYGNMLKYIKMGASSNFGNMFSVMGGSIFLPFLPMAPVQILINNFLYDMSQVTLPSDNVDEEYLKKPTPWNVDYIKTVMIFFGPISSIFDFATYGACLLLLAPEPLFHTAWFIESLFTQTLVVYVIRTSKIPFVQSMPSKLLLASTLVILSGALLLVFSPFGADVGFVPLPLEYLGIIAGIVIVYLILVQLMKGWFIKKYGYQ